MNPQGDPRPLLAGAAGGDDAASHSSHRSARSLLERIQEQRNREQQQAAASNAASTTPQQIQVPRYNPLPQSNPTDYMGQENPGASNFFSNAWSNISESMEQGMGGTRAHAGSLDMDAQDALLPPSTHNGLNGPGDYSMSNYFMTFVADMYGLFQALPVIARWVVCLILLYIAIRLL